MVTRVCDFYISPAKLQAVAHVMRKTIEEYANERTGMWSNVRTSLTFAILSLRARGEIADAIVLQRLNALTFWGQRHADDVCELSVETSKPGLLCVSSLLLCTENAQHDWERQFPCIKAICTENDRSTESFGQHDVAIFAAQYEQGTNLVLLRREESPGCTKRNSKCTSSAVAIIHDHALCAPPRPK